MCQCIPSMCVSLPKNKPKQSKIVAFYYLSNLLDASTRGCCVRLDAGPLTARRARGRATREAAVESRDRGRSPSRSG